MKTKTLLLVGLCAIGLCSWEAQAVNTKPTPINKTEIADPPQGNETNNQRDLPNLYDCWSVFHGQGNCDGLYVGYDHVSVLQSVYLLNMPQYGCPDGTAYFTDISITEIYANNYPETGSQTYNQGYRLWVGNQWEYYNGYVDVDEMVYYYNNLCDIIDDEIDALNDDDFKVSAISCAIHQSPSLPNFYYFTFKLEYGKINCNHNNGE